MPRSARAGLIATALVFHASGPAVAEQVVLDLDAAVARAVARAPAAITARGQLAEAEATRTGAAILLADNPVLLVDSGPRFGGGGPTTTDVHVRLEQIVPLVSPRGPRRAVAEATIAHATLTADAALLDVRLEATTAFYEALHADRAVELAVHAAEVARHAAEVAERKRRAGDLTELDASMVLAAAGRARATVKATEAERAATLGKLARLIGLGVGDTVVLRGELRPPAPLALDDLVAAAAARPDVRALAAEQTVAARELALARTAGAPALGVFAQYGREEDQTIVLGGVGLTLPIWSRGQGERAEARAKAARAAAAHEATRHAATREVADAFAAYVLARDAVDLFESEVLPPLDRGEQLLARSLETGVVTVPDYLVARQQSLELRREHLDRQLALATAYARARLLAGVTR